MTANAQSAPKKGGGPPKRRLRNYLLEPRFQLKYTGYVVLVTVLVTSGVGSWLGYRAYEYSTGMSDMLVMQDGGDMGDELDPALQEFFEDESAEADAEVRNTIIGGIVTLIVVLSVLLGLMGIYVTHRIVGPAYKLKLLLGQVERGNLGVQGRLRKGDELQDVGDAFGRMVEALRSRQEEEIAEIDAIATKAEEDGVDEAIVERLTDLRDRMKAALE